MKAILLCLRVLLHIGDGLKLAAMHLPILDYPWSGPMGQRRIAIQQPNLNVP